MGEVVDRPAKTIHRLLEWLPGKGQFKKGEDDLLVGDFFILDECSMLDIHLANSFFKAVPSAAQVLFIGDPDQLPSVGAGAVLKNFINSPWISHICLTQIFRQAKESMIVQCAHQINRGKLPKIDSPFSNPKIWKTSNDCFFIDSEEATKGAIEVYFQSERYYFPKRCRVYFK